MEFSHTSVLAQETIAHLQIKEDGMYLDGTLGGGGHSEAICKALSPSGRFIGVDRDQDAIGAAQKRLDPIPGRKVFVQDNYCNIKEILRQEKVEGLDGALLDLGVSSFQLDNEKRGFAYKKDAPLDMRMDQSQHFRAWQVVNEYDEKSLTRIIKEYGEERWAKRIAAFIVDRRKTGTIETTFELVDVIKSAIPKGARKDGPHPAKRTFQAIRIEVNQELTLLKKAVEDFCDVLNPGGRFCVITFHSLEDRIVKDVFRQRENPCTCPPNLPVCVCGRIGDVKRITGRPIIPGEKEREVNPRSRSAKLRVIEKKERAK